MNRRNFLSLLPGLAVASAIPLAASVKPRDPQGPRALRIDELIPDLDPFFDCHGYTISADCRIIEGLRGLATAGLIPVHPKGTERRFLVDLVKPRKARNLEDPPVTCYLREELGEYIRYRINPAWVDAEVSVVTVSGLHSQGGHLFKMRWVRMPPEEWLRNPAWETASHEVVFPIQYRRRPGYAGGGLL